MQSMIPVILLGHGGNYADIVDTIEDLNETEGPRYELLGFLDNRDQMQDQCFHCYPVLGRYADASRISTALFSTWIGGVGTYLRRPGVLAGLEVPLERFVTLVHPSAYVSRRAQLGRGVIVFPHCTIAAGATSAGERVVDGERDERPRVFSALAEEVVRQHFRRCEWIEPGDSLAIDFRQPRSATQARRQAVELFRLEHLGRGTHQMHV